jgi:phosphopantothenoylcysteine decarboxylase/phosphopantothenate--cysteine ligase
MEPETRNPLQGRRLVLGVTGSIAAYKAAGLTRLLVKAGAEVQPVLTASAARFIPALTLSTLAKREALASLFPGDEAPGGWTKHVALGLWADGVVVAPATAHTLAKLAHGLCDDMLTAVVLSARCPVLVCPAMDHDMWRHPATRANLDVLRGYGYTVLPPAHGELASGLVGDGRLPEPEEIFSFVAEWLGREGGRAKSEEPDASSLVGKKVLVTAGPTREPVDPVRFLSNGSTGTMGFALAGAAARRGARVVLVAGPVALPTPPGVERVDVATAAEMHAAALAHADADLVLAAAAVADYAPAEPSAEKQHKRDDGADLVLQLRRTPDVLAALAGRKRPGQVLVGFALETHDGEASARAKLVRKRLDWIALNYANEPGAGFGAGTNRVTLLAADGARAELPPMPKAAVAEALLDRVTAGLAADPD